MNKKVVFISTILPYPINTGKKVTFNGLLNFFIKKYGSNNITYIVIGAEDNELTENIRKFGVNFINVEKPNFFIQVWNLFWLVCITHNRSIQESLLYSYKNRISFNSILRDIEPDLVICDTVRISQYFETEKRYFTQYIHYMDDLFSVRYTKMIEAMEHYPMIRLQPLGNFARFLPKILHPFVEISSIQKLILRLETHRISKREKRCVKWFKTSLLVNENERMLLKEKTGSESIKILKPMVRTVNDETFLRRFSGEPSFVFLGALNIPHNDVSIKYFINSQIEKLLSIMPDFKLRIIGQGASSELLELVQKYNHNIQLEGYVEDLTSIFQESAAMLVPLLFGSGIKLKVLEAFAKGLPVIATSFGVEGIEIVNGLHCIVENNINNYPGEMQRLCNPLINNQIAYNAYEFFNANYSNDILFKEYESIFCR